MSSSKVSIIILNWNGLKDTIECLESLKKITYPNYEVIVVDNGSEGNDADVLEEKYKDYIKVIRNKENLGFTEGNNVAIRQILNEKKSEYILLLNNDVVVDKEFLIEVVKVAESDSKIGICGSQNYYYDFNGRKDIIWYAGAKIKWWMGGSVNHSFQKKEVNFIETEYVVGSSMLVKTNLLRKIGLLDKSYFSYAEDADLYLRAKKAGYNNIYVPTSKIWHKISKASGINSPFQIFYRTRNSFWLIKNNFKRWQYIIFVITFLFYKQPIWLIRFLSKGQFKQIRAFYKGLKEGLI